MSFMHPNADLNSVTNNEESIPRPTTCHMITPNKIDKMRKYFSGNSIDESDKSNLKIKNINLEYYGIKPRASSRQNKRSKKLEVARKHRRNLINPSFGEIENIPHQKEKSKDSKEQEPKFRTFYKNNRSGVEEKLRSLCDDFQK
jgi:hypothetical protein